MNKSLHRPKKKTCTFKGKKGNDFFVFNMFKPDEPIEYRKNHSYKERNFFDIVMDAWHDVKHSKTI